MKFIHQLATKHTQSQLHTLGAASIGVLMLIGVGLAAPAWARRNQMDAMRASLGAAEARLQRTHDSVDQARRETTALQAKLDTAASTFTGRQTLDQRLVDVSSIASEFGLVVDSVEPGSTVKKPEGELATAINASGRGPYPAVLAFVHRLRERAPDVTLDSVEFSATSDRQCTFHLAMSWWAAPVTTFARPTAVAGGER